MPWWQGKNNASEVDEVMGTFRATSQPRPVAVVHPACLSLWVCSSVSIVSLTSVARKKDTWVRYLYPRPKSPPAGVYPPRAEVIMGLDNPRFYESRKSEWKTLTNTNQLRQFGRSLGVRKGNSDTKTPGVKKIHWGCYSNSDFCRWSKKPWDVKSLEIKWKVLARI